MYEIEPLDFFDASSMKTTKTKIVTKCFTIFHSMLNMNFSKSLLLGLIERHILIGKID